MAEEVRVTRARLTEDTDAAAVTGFGWTYKQDGAEPAHDFWAMRVPFALRLARKDYIAAVAGALSEPADHPLCEEMAALWLLKETSRGEAYDVALDGLTRLCEDHGLAFPDDEVAAVLDALVAHHTNAPANGESDEAERQEAIERQSAEQDRIHADISAWARHGMCRRCGSPLTDAGYCVDETCPYSDDLQGETWTED